MKVDFGEHFHLTIAPYFQILPKTAPHSTPAVPVNRHPSAVDGVNLRINLFFFSSFAVRASHLPVPDWFDHLLSFGTVYSLNISSIKNLQNLFKKNIPRNVDIQTGTISVNVISVLCC